MWLTRPLLSLSAQIIKIGSVAALSERGALCILSWCTAPNFWHPSFATTSPRKASSEFRVARTPAMLDVLLKGGGERVAQQDGEFFFARWKRSGHAGSHGTKSISKQVAAGARRLRVESTSP